MTLMISVKRMEMMVKATMMMRRSQSRSHKQHLTDYIMNPGPFSGLISCKGSALRHEGQLLQVCCKSAFSGLVMLQIAIRATLQDVFCMNSSKAILR